MKRGIEKRVFKIKGPFLLANVLVYLLTIEPLRGWNLRKREVEKMNELITEFIENSVIR